MDSVPAEERERAVCSLIGLEYDFFHCLSLVPYVHPCAAEQLHADFAIEYRYEAYIRQVPGTTLDDARRIIEAVRSAFPDVEAFVHASASVLSIVSIHGGEWRNEEPREEGGSFELEFRGNAGRAFP